MFSEIISSSSDFMGVDFLPGDSLVNFENTDNIVLFGEDTDEIQSFSTTLNNNASIFRMDFSPFRRKMLLRDCL